MEHSGLIREVCAGRDYLIRLLQDPYRPAWHFAIPYDNGMPGDPNGAFYAEGRYHLMFLYRNQNTQAYHWGHVSSSDLLHWRLHPDALTQENGDEGCFSGGAFVDDDGTAYLSFWKFPAPEPAAKDDGGICIASSRPPYDVWKRLAPMALEGNRTPWGTMDHETSNGILRLGCADPSNIWKANGMYYMQTGCKCVLDAYGTGPDADEHYRGDWTELFRSRDLRNWEYVRRFYTNPRTDPSWPDNTEDDMCPSYLPLPDEDGRPTGKYLQLFISHNKGAQYYIGRPQREGFIPESHGRCSWKDNTCFAPEALIDDSGRQLAWFWLLDNRENEFERFGWSGVYTFPREFRMENGTLHMAPARELDALQTAPQTFDDVSLTDGNPFPLPLQNGTSCRIRAHIRFGDADIAGVRVRMTPDGSEYTEISVDRRAGLFVMDTSHSGPEGRCIREEAPFTPAEDGTVSLDILIDRCVIEAYADTRQAIARRVYPSDSEKAVCASVFACGGQCKIMALQAWEIVPASMY